MIEYCDFLLSHSFLRLYLSYKISISAITLYLNAEAFLYISTRYMKSSEHQSVISFAYRRCISALPLNTIVRLRCLYISKSALHA